MSDYTDIPEELLFYEVLTRLPVKSLGRFMCVSKSWYALIESPKFIKLHHRIIQTKQVSDVKIMCKLGGIHQGNPPYDSNMKLYSCDFHSLAVPHNGIRIEKVRNLKGHELPELMNPGRSNIRPRIEILGSCNGLVCIGFFDGQRTSHRHIIFYNPLTQKHCCLPPFIKHAYRQVAGDDPFHMYGFGYDAISEDFKLVVLVQWRSVIIKTEMMKPHQVFVYSHNSDSWRKVADSPFCVLYSSIHCNGVFVGNALHWIMCDSNLSLPEVAAFDLSTERFYEVPIPPYPPRRKFTSIGNLGGCLCVLYELKREPHAEVELWVMKEDDDNRGVERSWTKLTWHLPIAGERVTPLGCTKDQQILFQIGVVFCKFVLMQHDFRLQFSKFIALPPPQSDLNACICYGSLFEPGRRNKG